MSEADSAGTGASGTHDAGDAAAAGPVIRIAGQATPEEVAAVTAALAVVLSSAGESEHHEHQSGWVVAARLEAQGHPPISTLRHIAAHAATH